jgi:ABC-2 type transport system ATP-binding protein
MTAAAICRGLVKRYPDVVAVDGLDLEVPRGECFGLLGPNGAGKTTTVEMMEGLTVPDAGRIELFGHAWGAGHDTELRARIGVALQETKLPERLTVEETLRMFRSFYPRGRAVEAVIEDLALGEKRASQVGKLSGGQRQRLALGCALVGAPELLFLDEPTTGLDPQARRSVWAVVERFRAEGGTVVLTTHYMEEAAQLCQRLAIVDHGKVIAQGTPEALIAALEAPELIELDLAGETSLEAWLASLPGVRTVHRTPDTQHYQLAVAQAAELLPQLLAGLPAHHTHATAVSTRSATLEDVFIHLTGRGLRDG